MSGKKLIEAATFYPNEKEFENPMEYVRGIFQEANSKFYIFETFVRQI